jgi:adenine-specific DNA-methyltransferase
MNAAQQKLRGGYYTPASIASLLAEWAIRAPGATVLEPSCGDGEILASAASRLAALGGGELLGVELMELEARKCSNRIGAAAKVVNAEFFGHFSTALRERSFDVVLGNPPFIRYQHVPEAHRDAAFAIMHEEGLKPSRLTNLWVPFVVAGTAALADNGRLGLVIPAELMQVGYAAELRAYLAASFSKVTLVTFRRLVFEGVQQEVVLLLAEGAGHGPAAIRVIEVDDAQCLTTLGLPERFPIAADMDHASEKWTQYYLDASELALVRALREHPKLTRLGALADVDVGVVTGRNEFFVLRPSQAADLGLEAWTTPLVGRSNQLEGIELSLEDWQQLEAQDAKCLLLTAPPKAPRAVRKYVDWGETQGFHTGYKCRIRRDWHVVPSVWIPDAFMFRQIYDAPRLVLNRSGATATDTIHRMRLLDGVKGPRLMSSFFNSLTFAFAEVYGRSYGGGVLELEPTEAEALPIPYGKGLSAGALDRVLRERGVRAAVELNDAKLLSDWLGLSDAEVDRIRGVWQKLMQRRLGRKSRRAPTHAQLGQGANGSSSSASAAAPVVASVA